MWTLRPKYLQDTKKYQGKHQKNFKQKLALYNYLQNIKAIKIDLEVVGLMKYDSQVNLLWIISK